MPGCSPGGACSPGPGAGAGPERADEPPCDIVEVGFKGGRVALFRVPSGMTFVAGDHVIVDADRGLDCGTVRIQGPLVRLRLASRGLDEKAVFPNVVRRAGTDDLDAWERIREREDETFLVGRRTIEHMNLPMKLVDVEWQFDGRRVTFYFTAEERVDFRELVRRLARRFRTRVELRQIGARDEAARIGGIGSCGRALCCATWLASFRPVTTQAARTQGLSLSPVRLSGQCGRLKCCLNYELEQYVNAMHRFPAVSSQVTVDGQEGTVRKIDIFRERVWVEFGRSDWRDVPLASVQRDA